jgi:hypothetical protein
MFYIVTEKSPIYGKLQDLRKKMKSASKASLDLAKKHGFPKVRPLRLKLAGGISSFGGKKKPENFAFAFGSKYPDDFFPKKLKKNKDLLQEIAALPIVEYDEVNTIVNFDDRKHVKEGFWVFCPGFSFHKDFVLFHFSATVNDSYKPVKGMKEITHSEFKLKAKLK